MLTVNGRVSLRRIRWHGAGDGSCTPLDVYLDKAEQTMSVGAREIGCRLNGDGKNFDRAAENLARAAQIHTSGETLRVMIEDEGKQVLKAQQSGVLVIPWTVDDCQTKTADDDTTATGPTRIYLGSDGVMVPLVTDVEKKKRRQKIKENRRRRGKRAKPLPKAKPGADQEYKEFKIVAYYDETQDHRIVAGTKGDCSEAGVVMRRLATRIHLKDADEKIGNIDGSPWIRNQIERRELALDAVGLDFYHLGENVHKARRIVYGEGDQAGETWADDALVAEGQSAQERRHLRQAISWWPGWMFALVLTLGNRGRRSYAT